MENPSAGISSGIPGPAVVNEIFAVLDMLAAKARATAERDGTHHYTDLLRIVGLMVEKSVVIEHDRVANDFRIDIVDVLGARPGGHYDARMMVRRRALFKLSLNVSGDKSPLQRG